RIDVLGAGDGVTSTPAPTIRVAVITTWPATLPVDTGTSVEPLSAPAGMVMVVVVPDGNPTEGSGTPESGTEAAVRVTVRSTGNGLASDTVTRGCCRGFAVALMPPKFNGGAAGSAIVNVKLLLTVAPAESFAVTVRLMLPGEAGVPESVPPEDMVSVA